MDVSRAGEWGWLLQGGDSSTAVVNAGTCFADGGELGVGAEIGNSTFKIHVFGPIGAREPTARESVVFGDGQVRG